jgi:hypothetical protein
VKRVIILALISLSLGITISSGVIALIAYSLVPERKKRKREYEKRMSEGTDYARSVPWI